MCVLAYPFTDTYDVFLEERVTGGDAMRSDVEHLHHVIYMKMKEL